MRSFPLLLLLTLVAACASVRTSSTPIAADLALTHVAVVDVESGRVLPGQTVLIAGNRIQAVGSSTHVRVPSGVQVVDATGKYVIPGLWDTHVHLTFTTERALPRFVAYGITSVRDVGGRFEEIRAMRQRVTAGELIGPRIKTSGPVLEGAPWMQAAQQFLPPEHHLWELSPRVIVAKQNAQTVVDSLARVGVDFIKARNVWGEDFLALAAATERARIPLASHNPNRVNMLEAAHAGLDSFEHAESISGDFDTLSVPALQRMFERVGETRVLVAPTLMADVGSLTPDSIILAAIADTLGRIDPRNRILPEQMRLHWREAMEAAKLYGKPTLEEFEKITRDVRAMHRAGIPFLAGTDVGGIPLVYPGASLHEELELLVREGGLTPLEALQSATRNPPRFFGMQDELGTIVAGRIADLVLLEANPLEDIRNTQRISAVVLDGRYLDRPMLDERLAHVEATANR